MSETNALNKLVSVFDEGCFNELYAYGKSSVICAFGTVCGVNVYAYIQNGALDTEGCGKIKKTYSLAEKTGCPVVSIFNSNGLKLDEGFGVLGGYGEIIKYSSRLSGVVPQIAVINGNCLGVMSVCANLADVVIAVDNSDYSITVPSEITAEENSCSGSVDLLCESFEDACEKVFDLITLLPSNNLSSVPDFEFDETAADNADSVSALSDNQISVEFKKDYAKEIKTVLTTLDGKVCGIIDFCSSEINPAAMYKAEGFIKLCDAYSIPIITFADSKGIKRENEAQTLVAATKLTSAYASATTVKISVVTKESLGGAFVLLAGKASNSDLTFIVNGATVSPLSVESAVSFLWNYRLEKGENRSELEEEYKNTVASSDNALNGGAADGVFEYGEMKNKISSALDMLSGKRETTLSRKHTVK